MLSYVPFILKKYAIFMMLLDLPICFSGGFCARRYINGKWKSIGDCPDTRSMDIIKPQTTTTGCFMGMESGLIPNSSITASTFYNSRFLPYNGRLDNKKTSQSAGAWAPKTSQIGEWLQVDFGRVKEIAGIITQGRPRDLDHWVRTFKIQCNELEQRFETVQENGHDKIFVANNESQTKAYNRFPNVINCRRIRIYPETWNGLISMRVEFVSGRCFDKAIPCIATRYMGMKSGAIPDTAITASSYFDIRHGPFLARLDNQPKDGNTGSWSAELLTHGGWWQVDLGSVTRVAGLITQGRPYYGQWVQTYTVSYGKTLPNSTMIRRNGTDTTFEANTDGNGKVFNEFPQPLLCRYIRIYPQTWHGRASMRVEIVACA